ncbi:MAG: acetate kinase [Planctomycetota bacterium]|nr:acetate kinase [Planctomycetota bacterium]
MKVFVVNCGSSSIKYQLFDMTDESVLGRGVLERLGTGHARLHHTADGTTREMSVAADDHTAGMKMIVEMLVDPKTGVLSSIDEVEGVGHRVVHGAEEITESRLIDEQLLAVIRRNVELAPLHNPPNLAGIEAASAAMPNAPHVAVFDTAFLTTLPPVAYRYAVPEQWYAKHHVRRYGFHGTSHRYVTLRAAELLGKPVEKVNLITAHLGNGCSMTAIAGGVAVDHSMGMTPLEGLIMGTRSGDVDPAIVLYMISRGLSAEEVDRAMNNSSGLLGVSQCSNDMRDVLAAADKGNPKAALAVEMFAYRVAKYVGAYHAILPAVDAVVLTGGIGENSVPVRRAICRRLVGLGVVGDQQRNDQTVGGKDGPITAAGSAMPVWVVPTNEELMIARDTRQVLAGTDG